MTHNYNNNKICNQATHSTLTLKKNIFSHTQKMRKKGGIYFAVLLLSCQRKNIQYIWINVEYFIYLPTISRIIGDQILHYKWDSKVSTSTSKF